MRLTANLVRLAGLLMAAALGASGCNTSSSSGGCPGVKPASATITSAQACKMLEESPELMANLVNGEPFLGATCDEVCTNQSVPQCMLPGSYVSQAQALNADAGASPEDGGTPGVRCPTGPATMTVSCLATGCP